MRTPSTEERLEQEFCEMINEEGPVVIMGISFDRSHILKEMDPIAYDIGLGDFFDVMGFDPDYYGH